MFFLRASNPLLFFNFTNIFSVEICSLPSLTTADNMTKPKSKKGDKLVEDAGEQGACQSDEAQAVANSTDPVNLADIMEAIKSMNGSMNEKFDSLESTLSQTLVSLSEVTSRVTDLEKASADYEGRILRLTAATGSKHVKLCHPN